MKAQIHPKWYSESKVTCACGNTFTVGATIPAINVEVCSNCHPFYTGQMKFLDVAGRVDAFRAKIQNAQKNKSKTEKHRLKKLKKIQEQEARPETLAELRKATKK